MNKYVCVAFIIVMVFMMGVLHAHTIRINLDGTGDYTSIQEGIDNSVDGDTVLVYPGTYVENVVFNGKCITLASLELITNDERYIDSTIIDGNQISSCIRLDDEETATIRGLSLTNGYGYYLQYNVGHIGGGILAYSSVLDDNKIQVSIINCKIYDNFSDSGGGITIRMSIASLSGVDIYNNCAIGGGGLHIRDDSEVIFDTDNLCNIYNNYAGQGSDIFGIDTGDIDVIVDTFTVMEPKGYFALYTQNVHHTGQFTFDIQNNWLETVNHDLYVAPDGDDSNSGLTQDEPLRTIAWALHKIESDSLNPKTVHVATGTYSRTLNDQIFPLGCKSYVSVAGEDMNTLLNNDFFTSHTITCDQKHNFSIENFILHHDGNDNTLIFMWECDSVQLKNLVIENNDIDDDLIALYEIYDMSYENITIRNNEAKWCAGLSHDGGNARISNCVFDNNHAMGYSNFYFVVKDSLLVENCIFSNASSSNSGYSTFAVSEEQFQSPKVSFKNCLFYGNQTSYDVAINTSIINGETNFINCTFADNSADRSTLYVVGDIDMYNTIMHDSTDYEVEMDNLFQSGIISQLDISYCTIKNGDDGIYNEDNVNTVNWLGENIYTDPLFTGTGDYPYYLSNSSPCIDAGTPDTSGLHIPWLDVAGNPRIYNGRIDMGALEWQGYSVDPDTNVVDNLHFFKNTPNPFRDQTTISFTSLDYDRVRDYTLSIYNSRGQLVRRFYGPDEHFWAINEIVWDGKDMDGNITAPGVYFYSLEYEDTAVVRKMLRLR